MPICPKGHEGTTICKECAIAEKKQMVEEALKLIRLASQSYFIAEDMQAFEKRYLGEGKEVMK